MNIINIKKVYLLLRFHKQYVIILDWRGPAFNYPHMAALSNLYCKEYPRWMYIHKYMCEDVATSYATRGAVWSDGLGSRPVSQNS